MCIDDDPKQPGPLSTFLCQIIITARPECIAIRGVEVACCLLRKMHFWRTLYGASSVPADLFLPFARAPGLRIIFLTFSFVRSAGGLRFGEKE